MVSSFKEFLLNEGLGSFSYNGEYLKLSRYNHPLEKITGRQRFKLLDGSKAKKFIESVIKKCALYLKKDFMFYRNGEEFQEKVLEKIRKELTKQVNKNGSIPTIDSSIFKTDSGDSMRDIFQSFELSYDTMLKIEDACTMVAYRQKLIPKDWKDICFEICKKYDPSHKTLNSSAPYKLYLIVCHMEYLNDKETLTSFFHNEWARNDFSLEDKEVVEKIRQDVIEVLGF